MDDQAIDDRVVDEAEIGRRIAAARRAGYMEGCADSEPCLCDDGGWPWWVVACVGVICLVGGLSVGFLLRGLM